MKLILIHGRDQQGKDPVQLKNDWVNAWGEGLKKNGLTIPDGLEIVFPFYGDLLDELVKQGNMPDSMEGVIARGDTQNPEVAFFNDFLLELAENENIPEQEILANYEGLVQERGPLNWGWVQAILKTLDRTPLGSLSLKKFTFDVYMYLTVPGIRRRINAFVTKEIDDNHCVMLAHSLGSVVGYNILRDSSSWKVKKYITVGSPLGVRSVRSRLDTPLSMPGCVSGGWYNAFDERDVVALQPLDQRNFGITPEIDNYNKVRNHTSNRHGVEGYLDDAVVAKAIYDALMDG